MNPNPTLRKSFLTRTGPLSGLLSYTAIFATASIGFAQPAPPPDAVEPASTSDKVIELSVFEVNAEKPNRYQAADSTSGGRVSTEIFLSPQTVNVVTSDLIKDVAAKSMVDALKYVPGVSQNIISNAADYITIRGFQFVGRNVDGFATFAQSNMDPVIIDRIEVVKGPNAILSPAGNPGGTINNVTKKPLFTPENSLTVSTGLFDAGGVEFDSTGPISGSEGKAAYRVVGAVRNYDYYYKGASTASFIVEPSFTYRFNPQNQLTVQAELASWRGTNYLGIPVDPSSGSTNDAKLLAGVPKDIQLYNNDINREERRQEYRAFFTSQLTEHLSMRVAARYYIADLQFSQLTFGGDNGGSRDPRTGLWTPGIIYGPAPDFLPSPAPAPSRTFTQAGNLSIDHFINQNFQNDWVYQRSFAKAKSTTAIGFAYARQKPDDDYPIRTNRAISNASFNIDAVVLQPYTPGNLIQNFADRLLSRQYYGNEVLSMWSDRISLSGGISHIEFSNSSQDLLAQTLAITKASTDSYNYGIVLKPLTNVSVFYGHSENASPLATSFSAAGTPPFSEGVQNEIGMRVRMLGNRLQASLVHFHIAQSAVGIANPGNLTVPAPNPPLPNLFSDRTAKGWEFEFAYEITKGFLLLGSATDFKNRDPFNVPFRGTAERSGSLGGRYEFKKGSLTGLNFSLGASYLGRVPGDQASGLTAASTPTNVIPNQPSFWLPPRTLVNLSVGYAMKSWQFQINVDNVLNKEYLAASVNRFLVFPGTPRNLRASVTYKF